MNIVADNVENFSKAKVNDMHYYLLLTDSVILTEDAIRLVKHDLPLVNRCSLLPVSTFSFTCPKMCFK